MSLSCSASAPTTTNSLMKSSLSVFLNVMLDKLFTFIEGADVIDVHYLVAGKLEKQESANGVGTFVIGSVQPPPNFFSNFFSKFMIHFCEIIIYHKNKLVYL